MKKIFAIMLAALFIFCGAFAELESAPLLSMEGIVLEIAEDGSYLINTVDHGDVQVLVSDETFTESTRDISVGDYLYIDYDGQMTRSLPPQISASVVRMYSLEGTIIETYPEENAVLLMTETNGEVYVTLPADWAGQEITVEALTVYFNGAMTMSLPPQVNAGYAVPGYSLQGVVTEITEEYLVIGEEPEAVQVNFEAGLLPEDTKVGDVIRVIYNGMMTRSLPPQVSAGEIIQISR